jgi:hypothetical protein
MGALGNRDFRRLWPADLASQFGNRIDVLASAVIMVCSPVRKLRDLPASP